MITAHPRFAAALALALTATPAALLLSPAAPAAAQNFSQGYEFLQAVRERDGTKVTEILDAPGTTVINTRDAATGRTALHIVVERRDLVWVRFMLSRGVDENLADRQGTTPLHIAANLGFAEAVRALIDAGASVNQDNNRGETALHFAVQRRDVALIRMLIEAGANADRQDSVSGLSPREYAERDSRGAPLIAAMQPPTRAPVPVITPGGSVPIPGSAAPAPAPAPAAPAPAAPAPVPAPAAPTPVAGPN